MKKKILSIFVIFFVIIVSFIPVFASSDSWIGSAWGLYSAIDASGLEYMNRAGVDSSWLTTYQRFYNGEGNCCEAAWFYPSGSIGYKDGNSYRVLKSNGSLASNSVKVLFNNGQSSAIGMNSEVYPYVTNDYYTVLTDFVFPFKVFDSRDNALKYLETGEENGLISDNTPVTYDPSVPAPTEVHIESRYLADEGCPRTTIAFKSSETYEDSGMRTEIRYRYTGTFYESGVFGDSKNNRKSFVSPIYTKDLIKTLSVNYVGNTSNNNTVVCEWYDEFMNNDAYKNYKEYKEVEANKAVISWICAPFNSIEYWIRNVSKDNKASDWVHCKYNYDTGELEETWTDTVPGGTTTVIDGSVNPGEETVGDVKDSYEIDSNIKNDSGFDTNSAGLISSIKDLFSDNGVVGIVKAIYSFMPNWMIVYISLFFTILIALMILYFVRG